MLNLFINKNAYKGNRNYATLCQFINDHADGHEWDAINTSSDMDYFMEAGYETGGPVLFGYINWLHEQFKRDGIEKIFFLARDGQLMQKVYQQIYNDIPCEYMYASRRALIVPTLWMHAELEEINQVITLPMFLSIKGLLKRMGLDYRLVEGKILKAGFDSQKLYKGQSLLNNDRFKKLYENTIKPKVVQNSREQYELFLLYLKQLKFQGNVAIVDIGWFGRMQSALGQIIKSGNIPVKLHGYYLGLKPESQLLNQMSARGYLFDKDKNIENAEKEAAFNPLVEIFFTANHGTTLGYAKEEEIIVPVLDKWEYSLPELKKDYNLILALQKGALAFVKDAGLSNDLLGLAEMEDVTFFNWIQLGCYPSSECVKRIGSLHYEDNGIQSFIVPRKGKSYFLHPQLFIHDFITSGWRIGFLARTFETSLFCFEVYKWIRRLAHKAN